MGFRLAWQPIYAQFCKKSKLLEKVKDILTSTGFFEFAKKDPFEKAEFIEALKIAPTIKTDYYTILAEKDSFEKAIHLIETDEILKELIK